MINRLDTGTWGVCLSSRRGGRAGAGVATKLNSGIHQGHAPLKAWVAGHGLRAVRRFEAPLAGESPAIARHNLDRDTDGFGHRRGRRRASDVPAGVVLSTTSLVMPVPKTAITRGGQRTGRRAPFVVSAFARLAARPFARLLSVGASFVRSLLHAINFAWSSTKCRHRFYSEKFCGNVR